jgi:hypothetical protein
MSYESALIPLLSGHGLCPEWLGRLLLFPFYAYTIRTSVLEVFHFPQLF